MSPRFSCVTSGVGSCSLDLPQVGWCSLKYMEDLANNGWFSFCLGLVVLWLMGVGFENTCTVSRN